ncbi:MAG: MGMT family protein [Microgenomates group bacterium]
MAEIAVIREKVFEVVAKVPLGFVTTYKTLALLVGTHPRVIGMALHTNDDPTRVPCHRVVHSDGRMAGGYVFGGPDAQRAILEKEGVKFTPKGKVLLKNCQW